MRRWVVVALLVVAGLPACGGSDGPLFDDAWILTGVSDGGQQVDVASPSSHRWRFVTSGACDDGFPDCPAGPKLLGSDLCNTFTRSIRVDGDVVVWGAYWATTAAECGAAGRDPVAEFYRQESFRFVIDGDELRATSSDGVVELRFTASR